MTAFDHKKEIRTEQVRLLYEQLPSALFATVVNGAILITVLRKEVPYSLLVGWFLIIVLVSLGRFVHRRAYTQSVSGTSESLRWGRQYLWLVTTNGVLWGFASYLFFTPASYVHQVFLAFVLVGMASGGISTLSSARGAYLLFMMPSLIPYGVRLMIAGGELHLAMALMLVVYLTMMSTIGDRLYWTGRESLRLRFENIDLLQNLTQATKRQEIANQELAAQIAEKRAAQDALQQANADLETRVEERTAELAKSEEALRQADKRKNEFLAMLGHELRNPLSPIRSALQIMQKPGVSDSTLRWARGIIARQVDRLARLVDDLLDVSRIVHGKITLRETLLEIGTVISQAVEGTLPFLESRQQKVSVHIPEEPIWVTGDLVRLEQVISNLLNNAAKYSDAGQQIRVGVEASANWITVRIQDNGIGISEDTMPHIFELFTQADQTLTRTQGGLGIGLTVVKRLVEMHGGRVEAHSKGVGHGSEFIVHLPRQEDPAKQEIVLPQFHLVNAVEDGIRVLVVDDNPDAAESLAFLLGLEGYTVATAGDGVAALAEAAKFHPQVVLLDIGMPQMDGYEVARQLRAQEATQPMVLIAVTGYGQPEDRARAEAAGFTDHLTKPVEHDALTAVLKAHAS
jgi:signal transduction histidine kinase